MKESQGKLANMHGAKNRDSVAGILLAHGFEEIGPLRNTSPRLDVLAEFERVRLGNLTRPEKAFACDVPICHSVYGFLYKANFLVRGQDWPEPVALMCRAQHSGGSAIEKLEFLYANISERFPCRALVMLELTPKPSGKGLTAIADEDIGLSPDLIHSVYARAEHWVKRSDRIVRLFRGLSEFRCWLTEGSPYPPRSSQSVIDW